MLATHGEFALPSVPDFRPIVCIIHPRSATFVGFKLPFVRISRFRGFTLIELMIALLVLSILAFVAVPSIEPMMLRNRLTTGTNRLVSDLAYARNEAILRASVIQICTSADMATCDGSANWSNPLLVFVDTIIANGVPDPAEILRVGEAAPPKATTTATGMAYPLIFNERAMATTGGAGVKWTINITGLTETRDICLSAIGQTRIRKSSTDPDC
jgi:type IV fimbrial biogenesis protein FimT